MNIYNIPNTCSITVNRIIVYISHKTNFFRVIDLNSSEVFPRQNKYGFISESFTLNWYTFIPLANKNFHLHYNADSTIFFLDLVKFIEYLTSDVIFVSTNTYVGPSPRTKISFFSIVSMHWWTVVHNEIIKFLPNSPFIEKSECASTHSQ